MFVMSTDHNNCFSGTVEHIKASDANSEVRLYKSTKHYWKVLLSLVFTYHFIPSSAFVSSLFMLIKQNLKLVILTRNWKAQIFLSCGKNTFLWQVWSYWLQEEKNGCFFVTLLLTETCLHNCYIAVNKWHLFQWCSTDEYKPKKKDLII